MRLFWALVLLCVSAWELVHSCAQVMKPHPAAHVVHSLLCVRHTWCKLLKMRKFCSKRAEENRGGAFEGPGTNRSPDRASC